MPVVFLMIWHCVDSSGNHVGINMKQACQWQYQRDDAIHIVLDSNNPYSGNVVRLQLLRLYGLPVVTEQRTTLRNAYSGVSYQAGERRAKSAVIIVYLIQQPCSLNGLSGSATLAS
jgi:hypothetical protein